jgi:Holliday junction resolvasome RuvABC endonuclease subunit
VSESINGYGVERIHRELHQLMDNVHVELEALETTQLSTFVDPAAGAAVQAAQLDAFTSSDAGRAQIESFKYRFDQINQLSIQLIDRLGNSDSNIAEVEDVVINLIKRLAERHKEVLRALGEPDHSLLDRLQNAALRLMEKIKALFDKLGTVILGAPDNAAPGPRLGN